MSSQILRTGLKKRIHVNKAVIASNRKNGLNDPPITVQTSKGPIKAQRVIINGPSVFVHSPHQPLSCGARVWVETLAECLIE
jgi:hypothetical protein